MRVRAALLSALFLACGESAPPPRPPLVVPTTQASNAPIPPPPEARADGRLPPLAKPLRYAIHLDVDPRKDTFSGKVEIMVDLPEETAHVVLNVRGENIRRATVRIGDSTLPLTVTTRPSHGALEPDELVLSAARMVPKGRVALVIEYDAPFGKTLSGLYRATDANESYAFTQFEASDARRAFPCFDEPGFKTPFDVELTVPSDMLAFSNAGEASHAVSGGMTTFTFAPTAPLPTYLVAFAVGRFDILTAPGTTPPSRFITTHGRSALAKTSLDTATAVLPLLAKYFGIAYPYAKLDLVAVPDFGAGGMENAGFITFRDDAVLLDEHASARQKHGMVGLMTHELAHQWFGDLVTMKWWNDLWLNEGFATWATYKIVDEYKPSFGAKVDAAASAESIMDQDGLGSARAIRQPVASVGQAMEAFDGITYQKGAAILRMIERYAGADAFQKGVHAYLRDHAWGNATADDLLAAIDASAGTHDATRIATTYLDKPGVPLVVIDSVDCASGKSIAAHVHQERFGPLGKSFPPEPTDPWNVPFCFESAARGAKPECKLLLEATTLTASGTCPAFANPDAAGYYRVAWPESSIPPLMKKLDAADDTTKIAIIADAWAQTRAGKLNGRVLLADVLPAIDRETERHVIERLVSILYELSELVDDATWPAFSTYVRARLGPHLAQIPAGTVDDEQRLLRRTLTYAEVDLGEDAALLKKLDGVAKAFQSAASATLDPDYGQVALELAARSGDPKELQRAVETAATPQAHAIALRAAAGVVEPAAVRTQLDWALSPAVKLQDVRGIMWPLVSRHRSRAVALAYVRDHWDALRQKLPGALGRGLVSMAGFACTQPALDDSRAFYTAKAKTIEGADRPLAQALESASLCVALRDHLLPEMKASLRSSGAGGPARR